LKSLEIVLKYICNEKKILKKDMKITDYRLINILRNKLCTLEHLEFFINKLIRKKMKLNSTNYFCKYEYINGKYKTSCGEIYFNHNKYCGNCGKIIIK